MDIKQLLQNPQQAVDSRWPSSSDTSQKKSALDLLTAVKAAHEEYKQLQNDKKDCSKQFKFHKDDPEQLAALKQQTQTISNVLNELNTRKTQQEVELKNLFTEPAKPLFPPQFIKQEATERNAQGICIKLIDEQLSSSWDAYANKHLNASLYHQYRWRRIIEKSFGHASYYFAAFDEDHHIIGILPIVHINSRLFGSYGVSMPFFNYGGALGDSSTIAIQLIEHASVFATQNHWKHLEIRTTDNSLPWPAREDKVSMIRQLPPTEAELESQLGAKVRSQIKLAQQHNPETTIGHSELLNEFYRVFAKHMRDLGTPVYGKSFFKHILEANNAKQSAIVIIRINGEPVATAFLLRHNKTIEIPWASTLRKVNGMNMNMHLYREILGYCIKEKAEYFDFGRSSKDSGTYQFKKQWRAKPVENFWYYPSSNQGALPALNPNNPKFKLVIAIWQKLPVWVTRLIGPKIIKNLP